MVWFATRKYMGIKKCFSQMVEAMVLRRNIWTSASTHFSDRWRKGTNKLGLWSHWWFFFPLGKEAVRESPMVAKAKVFWFIPWLSGNGMPLANCTTAANGSEREQIIPLLDQVKLKTKKPGRPKKRVKVLATERTLRVQCRRSASVRCEASRLYIWIWRN